MLYCKFKKIINNNKIDLVKKIIVILKNKTKCLEEL